MVGVYPSPTTRSPGFIMSVASKKVPAAFASGIICLVLGGGLGAVIMWFAAKNDPQANAAPSDDKGAGDAKGSKGGPGGPGGMGGGGGGGFGGGKGPNPKFQLAQLVNKLDTLTGQSLHVELTPEQKKQAKEQLAGLAEKDELTDDEAKAKFEALSKLLEPHKKTFEDAGYRWPGAGGGNAGGAGGGGASGGAGGAGGGGRGGAGGAGGGGGGAGGGGPPAPPANPFKQGAGADHLKSLQATLSK